MMQEPCTVILADDHELVRAGIRSILETFRSRVYSWWLLFTMLAADVPEAWGGLDVPKSSSMLLVENLARAGSFTVTHGAHSGIGTLPIVYFGTGEQKKRWLPRLATGEIIGAYALTEQSSGSDALRVSQTSVPCG